jgi:hypothetical protein
MSSAMTMIPPGLILLLKLPNDEEFQGGSQLYSKIFFKG